MKPWFVAQPNKIPIERKTLQSRVDMVFFISWPPECREFVWS